jgi:DNA polymerase III subunit delta
MLDVIRHSIATPVKSPLNPMRVKPDQLQTTLKRAAPGVAAIIGEEPLLIRESVDALRAAAGADGFLDREVLSVESKFDWDALTHARIDVGLFAQQKLIELHLASAKLNKDGEAAIREFIDANPSDQRLLIRVDSLDGAARKEPWVNAIDQAGWVIDCATVPLGALEGWIAQRFAAAGFRPTPEAVALLAERSEGNLLAADQEIEKLKLIDPPGAVDATRIDALMADQARYDVYRLQQLALAGDVVAALRVSASLKRDGFGEPLVVWAMAEPIRQLAAIVGLTTRGMPFEAACERIGVWSARRGVLRAPAKRLGAKRLDACLKTLAELERLSKGQAGGNFWRTLDGLIAALGVRDGAALLPRAAMA